jgi:hypothetical protein
MSHATSQTNRLSRVHVMVAAAAIVSSGCAKRDTNVTPERNEPDDHRASPVFGVVPELVQADRACDLNVFVSDDGDFVAAIGKTAQQIAADVDVAYRTVLRWETIVPPFADVEEQESLDISLAYLGGARLYPGCENLVELDMELVLSSESGALAFDGPATLTHFYINNSYRLKATLSPSGMDEWMDALQSVTAQEPSTFTIDLDLTHGGSGNFSVDGPGTGTCRLARWPAQRFCEVGEFAVLPDETYLGLRTRDVVAGVQELEKGHRIEWDDIGATASMTVDFVPDESGLACVVPVGMDDEGQRQFRYAVPGMVHLVTDDHRLDVTIPTRARTRGREGAWSTVELFSNRLVAPESGFGMVPIELPTSPRARAVLNYSSPQPPITPQSQRLRGGIDLQAIELRSARANPSTASCVAGDFVGLVSPVLVSATYGSAEP